MEYNYNKQYVPNARELRKNMTKEEKHLWYDFLRKLPVTVHRQKNIGNYIVDFYIASKQIVIEIDGAQHGALENRDADAKRDLELRKLGMRVLRYSNFDINRNFRFVCEDIFQNLGLNEIDG